LKYHDKLKKEEKLSIAHMYLVYYHRTLVHFALSRLV
jgi:hypothetical protein